VLASAVHGFQPEPCWVKSQLNKFSWGELMPDEVRIAVSLLYASLLVGIAKVIVNPKPLPNAFGISVMVLVFGVLIWLAVKVSARKNWARITLLVLFVLGLPVSLVYLPFEFSKSKVFFYLDVLQILLQGAATTLLFGSSAAFFRKPSSI